MTNKQLRTVLTVNAFDLLLARERKLLTDLVKDTEQLTDPGMPSHRLMNELSAHITRLSKHRERIRTTMELLKSAKEIY